jgi:hypothetical protein
MLFLLARAEAKHKAAMYRMSRSNYQQLHASDLLSLPSASLLRHNNTLKPANEIASAALPANPRKLLRELAVAATEGDPASDAVPAEDDLGLGLGLEVGLGMGLVIGRAMGLESSRGCGLGSAKIPKDSDRRRVLFAHSTLHGMRLSYCRT